MNYPQLKLDTRTVVGRKVKALRKKGILPLSLYGKDEKSLSLQGDLKEILAVFQKAGETGLVELNIAKEVKPRTVLLKNPQFDPVTDLLVHLDLHQVKMTEKVTVTVPVELVGIAPAAEKGEGVLMHILNEIEIEALPADLPERFTADVSKLEKVNDLITVKDLGIDEKKITVKTGLEQVVAKVDAVKEEVVEPAPTAAPAEGEAKPAKGAAPVAEGAKPTEEAKKSEEKPAKGEVKPTENPKS
jgi:large subunit ribosomal protein L25